MKNKLYHLIPLAILIQSIYILTMSSSVYLEDDGLFIMAAYFNGTAHPPGYPLFTLFGHLISDLPISTVAFRIHLLSSFFGTLSCLLIWLIISRLTSSRSSSSVLVPLIFPSRRFFISIPCGKVLPARRSARFRPHAPRIFPPAFSAGFS